MTMNEINGVQLLEYMSWCMIFSGILAFVVLQFVNIPYGRQASSAFGFPVNVKLAWFVQEIPSLAVPAVFIILGTPATRFSQPSNQILIAMFLTHYVQRALIYPFLIRGGKATPFIPFILAFIFCMYNGYLQGRYLSQYGIYPEDWITDPRFIVGFVLWLAGLLLNLHSDHVLRTLRKPGEMGYKIPRGGMFEYVSGANFLGEIIEWTGFAVACWSLQSAAFAVFTFLILSTRAKQHHKWYLQKFEDYPKSRKILVPFLY
ncbi:3-oxo-5-alpha-steroid 4-dehydrogenase 1 isoform X2 [Protopterus annectens]|uniref:3-oxo-5-alpha-steroid 4-dehydrogenase 1 isoform X2 n=1 Tax=Protopterus annectens TaxID=7888 RepID=UPI001CFBE2F9|nr:3-oxo-5-alpha-steroid 4-dehydrogenase 1 isoform X2 [Protopterus annectens]